MLTDGKGDSFCVEVFVDPIGDALSMVFCFLGRKKDALVVFVRPAEAKAKCMLFKERYT